MDLYYKWLSLPHHTLRLGCYLADIRYRFWAPTPEIEAEVAAAITEEQQGRFKCLAEVLDIHHTYWKLHNVREGMENIRGVLKAQLEDEMADFNVEDFKEMEGGCKVQTGKKEGLRRV